MNVADQQDPLDFITNMLKNKSDAKQRTYKHLLDTFGMLRKEARLLPLT